MRRLLRFKQLQHNSRAEQGGCGSLRSPTQTKAVPQYQPISPSTTRQFSGLTLSSSTVVPIAPTDCHTITAKHDRRPWSPFIFVCVCKAFHHFAMCPAPCRRVTAFALKLSHMHSPYYSPPLLHLLSRLRRVEPVLHRLQHHANRRRRQGGNPSALLKQTHKL